MPWSVVRRFEDFESLLWALKPQGAVWASYQMPPTRWFNKHEPAFLEERRTLLQVSERGWGHWSSCRNRAQRKVRGFKEGV